MTDKTKLIFGDLESIKLANEGASCKNCDHPKSKHGIYCCNGETEDQKWCTCECGDVHLSMDDCDCEEFIPQTI